MFERIHSLTDRKFRSLTGLNKKDFKELTLVFSECEQEKNVAYHEAFFERTGRKLNGGGNPTFRTPTEKLFLILFYLKTYPTFDVLGFTFNCSGKTAHENLYKFLPVLEQALNRLKVLPKRNFDTVEEFVEYVQEHKNILIDATERIHHRKRDYQQQKAFYNGKKKHIPSKIL